MNNEELKAHDLVDIQDYRGEVYLKSEADKEIAELKQKLQDQCISCPVKMQEDDVVAELKQNLEDAKATAYADSVDAGMREHRLRRALWLARARRASAWQIHFALSHNHSIKREFTINGASSPHDRMVTMRTARDWAMIWENVERKCRAKAEEYK